MMIKDDADNRDYVTLLSLIADNSGKFDICALVYDICTGNKDTYYDNSEDEYVYESVHQRMIDVKTISKNAYVDLKRIINYIKNKYVQPVRDTENENNLIVFEEGQTKASFVSVKFDDVFIKEIIEKYYHDELYMGVKNGNKIR